MGRSKAIAFVLVAAVLWSGGGVGVKLTDLGALAIAGYRSAFALPLMLAALLVVARSSKESPIGLLKRPLVWGAAASYALMVLCFVIAAKKTTAANAILLQYTGPIYVALLSWPLLKERVRPRDWAAIAGCIVGMALFFGDEISLDAKQGNVIAIVGSFGFAGLPLCLRLEQRERPDSALTPIVAMTLGNVIAASVGLPSMIATPPPSAFAWSVLFTLGTFQIALPYLFYGVALRALSALESSIVATLEPILSPIWVLLATSERPSRAALVGGAVIVLSVVVQAARGASDKPAGVAGASAGASGVEP